MNKMTGVALAVLMLTGCATGLNSVQERQYANWKREGVLIEEKKPSTGAVLGLLPGGGSFYAGETGLGICNLLFWPLSILWDPVSGYDGAKAINYDMTKHDLQAKREKEISELDDMLTMDQITRQEYVVEKNRINSKYNIQ